MYTIRNPHTGDPESWIDPDKSLETMPDWTEHTWEPTCTPDDGGYLISDTGDRVGYMSGDTVYSNTGDPIAIVEKT